MELRMCIEGVVVPMISYPKPPKIDRVGNRVLPFFEAHGIGGDRYAVVVFNDPNLPHPTWRTRRLLLPL